ncbi:MAG: RT0821/Lpp0805 family surface protein [Alphaproteobacteria bacterium]
MRVKGVLVIGLTTFALVGCQTNAGQKETVGTLLGGAGGAVVGAQFGSGKGQLAATAAGTLLGAFIGNQVGKSLDRADQLYAQQAEQQAHAAPVGQTIRWENPDSGNSGTVTPVRNGTDTQTGRFCREYQTTVTVGGELQEAYGTACQRPDGTWEIVS